MLGWRRERSYKYATQPIDPARAIIPRFLNLPTELEEVTLNAWTPELDRSSLDLSPKNGR